MWQYIVKRLLLMLPTLIGAALVVFLLMHVVPGDIALLILGGDQGGDINPQELVNLAPSGRTLLISVPDASLTASSHSQICQR
jgi:ABC-type dipeptide/oligopeptide/nickel transport system permease component